MFYSNLPKEALKLFWAKIEGQKVYDEIARPQLEDYKRAELQSPSKQPKSK